MKNKKTAAAAIARGYDIITEGKARIAVPKYSGKNVSSRMPVFYNPVMKSNRDITILLMAAAAKTYGIKKWRVADPMAATGIRGIRMLLELGKGSVEAVRMNDYSAAAVKLIRKNLRINGLKESKKTAVVANEANKFLLNNMGFSYIDIDPFGYPGLFLDAAVKKISHKGILAVTATDTSALAGTAVNASRRKYLATPLRNSFMHETGIRILVRLVQLIGAMHEKALLPVFSYYKEHYIRAFFLCKDGAGRVDELLRQHKEVLYCDNCCERRLRNDYGSYRCGNCKEKMSVAGPLWAGKLFDAELASLMAAEAAKNRNIDEKAKQFMKIIAEEAKAETKTGIGFCAVQDICERHRISQQPKTADVIKRLRRKGYAASPTHCSTTGVKTNAHLAAVVAAVKGK